MKGLMMEYQLTLPTILRRAETLFGTKEIVTYLPDKSLHRYTYLDLARRAKKLSVALYAVRYSPGRSGSHAQLESLSASRNLFCDPLHGGGRASSQHSF